MGTTILRLDSASAIDGNLHQMDSADEEWISYQAGLRIADYLTNDYGENLSLAPYAVTRFSASANNIGTFTDTSYAAADSAAPGSLTTTNTNVYQKTGKVALSSDRRYPVEFVSGTPNQLTEMDSSEVDAIAGRLKGYLFDSDNHWAGVVKLGSSAPSAEYSIADAAFSDTKQFGAMPYYYYVKNYVTSGDSASIPTQSRPVSLKRASGLTGTFQGIQEMNDSDVGETFGRAIMSNVMATTNGIGAYQLRSATQGAPTDTGTWKAMGTATDTRRTVTAPIVSTRTSQGTRTANSTRNSTRTSNTNFTRTSNTNFTRTSNTDFTRTSQRTSTRNSDGTASTRTSTRNSTSDFQNNYIGFRLSTFTRERDQSFTSPNAYDGAYEGVIAGNFSQNYVTPNYLGNYTATEFLGNFVGNYETGSNFTRTSTRTSSGDFTRNSIRQSTLNSTRVSTTSPYNYTGDFMGNFAGDFIGNFVNEDVYAGNFIGNYAATRVTDSTRTSISADYVGDYQVAFLGNYDGTRPQDYVGTFSPSYTGDFVGNYTADYDGTVYTGNFIGNFDGNYLGNYIPTYEGNYVGNYTGNYLGTDYTGDFLGTDYTGDFVGTDYTGDYQGNYEGNFTTDYVGNYEGAVLEAGSSETVETYTLYLRCA